MEHLCNFVRSSYTHPQKIFNKTHSTTSALQTLPCPPALPRFKVTLPGEKATHFTPQWWPCCFKTLRCRTPQLVTMAGKEALSMEIVSQKGCDFWATTRTPQKNRDIKHRVVKVHILNIYIRTIEDSCWSKTHTYLYRMLLHMLPILTTPGMWGCQSVFQSTPFHTRACFFFGHKKSCLG